MAQIITAIIETRGPDAGTVSVELADSRSRLKGKRCRAVQEAFAKGLAKQSAPAIAKQHERIRELGPAQADGE